MLVACGASRPQALPRVDLDTVTYDPALAEPGTVQPGKAVPFVIAEVEVMAPRRQDAVDAAIASLEAFLMSHGLQEAPKAHSKLIEYLLRFRPEQLAALGRAGVLSLDHLVQLRASMATTSGVA